MSAEARRITNAEVWTEWEGQVVNGVYPLRRFLGRSNHSAVFLTEYSAENLPNVAIKFVPADPLLTEAQLVQWGTAATLSHPHLLRIFDVGRCQLGGRGFLFVVMEYAEQTLADILPRRALTPDEVRELLSPTLGALAFLHRNNLMHGQVKPSNILVVNDQLKLASDTVRPIGNSPSSMARTSSYDPPELKDGAISTAGDLWGLGITLVEALTQRPPTWPDERSDTAPVILPPGFPAPFADTVQRCLNRTPANRPTVTELEGQYKRAPQAQAAPAPQPARELPRVATASQSSRGRYVLPLVIATVLLLVTLAVWVLRFSQDQLGLHPSTSATQQADLEPQPAPEPAAPAGSAAAAASSPAALTQSAPSPAASANAGSGSTPSSVASALTESAAAARPAEPAPAAPGAASTIARSADSNAQLSTRGSLAQDEQSALPPATTSSAVLHEVTPEVSQNILNKIRGHINVKVRVLVAPSGDVVGEFLENAGPSRYFAHVAEDAAVEWKFAAADTQGPRVWLLRFEFTRGGATVDATAAQ
jgi:serine/threonine protein kinase